MRLILWYTKIQYGPFFNTLLYGKHCSATDSEKRHARLESRHKMNPPSIKHNVLKTQTPDIGK